MILQFLKSQLIHPPGRRRTKGFYHYHLIKRPRTEVGSYHLELFPLSIPFIIAQIISLAWNEEETLIPKTGVHSGLVRWIKSNDPLETREILIG